MCVCIIYVNTSRCNSTVIISPRDRDMIHPLHRPLVIRTNINNQHRSTASVFTTSFPSSNPLCSNPEALHANYTHCHKPQKEESPMSLNLITPSYTLNTHKTKADNVDFITPPTPSIKQNCTINAPLNQTNRPNPKPSINKIDPENSKKYHRMGYLRFVMENPLGLPHSST